jgi:DNA-binding MarR family transcriptional regulator
VRLSERLRQERFASNAQEALLNVLVTASWIQGEIARALSPHGITPAQYNVLRILRGSHPRPLPCAAIGERLIERTPDVTRLLDRLERAGWLTRQRAGHDRRVVEVAISDQGLSLLSRTDPDVADFMDSRFGGALSPDELSTLSGLLERLREAEAPAPTP